tara:strand:- start:301 stop:1221 length:921 start_codon:yes stop_codon:yes gene_type:complete
MDNVLVIGSGSIAKKHIDNLYNLGFRIYVFTSNNKFKEKNDKIKKIKNLNKIPKILFAIIANSTNNHLKYIELLIKKKINIYCEKPIFHKKFEYSKVRKLIIKNKVKFFSGYQLLQDTKVKYLKKKIKKLKIKSFMASVGHDFYSWRKDIPRKKSYFINTSSGGGVIFELVHEINLISNLFGKIEKIKTFKNKSNDHNCEDVAVTIIKTKNNIIGTLYQDMFSKFFFRKIKVITNKINYEIDFKKNLVLENDKIVKFNSSNSQLSLLKRNLMDFIEKLKNKNRSLDNYDMSVRDLKNCLKMHDKIK